MSTTREDQRIAVHLAALAALVLAAVAPLAVTILWFINLGCPELWQLLGGPVALVVVIVLMAMAIRSLGEDAKPGGWWDR